MPHPKMLCIFLIPRFKLVGFFLQILKLIRLRKLQEVRSCVTPCALNKATSMSVNFIHNFFIIQILKSIPGLL